MLTPNFMHRSNKIWIQLTLKGAQGGGVQCTPPSKNFTISGIDLVQMSKLVIDNSDIGLVGYSGQTPCV